MKILFLTISLLVIFVTVSFGQNCQTASQSVVVRGFSLGMTEESIKKRHPKIEFFKDLDVAGLSSWTSSSAGSSDDIFTEAERENLELIQLTFFDKKLSQIKVVYNGFTEWDSLTEFTDASSKALKLPPSTSWQSISDKYAVRLDCQDFYVVSKLDPARSNYELQEPSLFLSFNDFATKLEGRKKSQKETQKKDFKP